MNRLGITTAKLNLREGPSTDKQSINVLSKGSKVQFVEASKDGKWSLIYSLETDLTGWVYDRYVDWEAAPLKPAVLPLASINKVHSWPTYNIDLRGKYDRNTGLLYSGEWRIKKKPVNPDDVWSGKEPTYGWRTDIGCGTGEFHGAVDIVPEPWGTNPEVRSAFPGGVVKVASQGRPYNNQVLILTDFDGTPGLVIYQHLAPKYRVKQGDKVKSGQVIGRLGEWNGVEHLHAEVITKSALPVIDNKWGVPCQSGQTANSQFQDAFFKKWVALPYYMYNLIAVVDWYNRRYDGN